MAEEKIALAIRKVRAAHVALGTALDDLDALMMGERTPGQEAKSLVSFFAVCWAKRYAGQKYVPAWGRDIGAVKRLMTNGLTADDIQGRMRAYLHDADPFYVRARHPLPMFVQAVNKFGAAVEPRQATDDLLSQDAAETRRKVQESRR